MSDPITDLLFSGLKQKVYPGAVLLVAQEGDIVFFRAVGSRAVIPARLPMEKDTIFDLASLTKPLATTLAVMKLVDEGLLDLDVSLASVIQPFSWQDKPPASLKPRFRPRRLEAFLPKTGTVAPGGKKGRGKAPYTGRALIL